MNRFADAALFAEGLSVLGKVEQEQVVIACEPCSLRVETEDTVRPALRLTRLTRLIHQIRAATAAIERDACPFTVTGSSTGEFEFGA